MNDAKKQAFEAEIRSYVGKPIGPPVVARDPVNEPMIRQWCDAMGEEHPAYIAADTASATVHGRVVAPPTMLQAWIMEGWEMHVGYDEPRDKQEELHKLFNGAGYTGVVATDTRQQYNRFLVPGDVITAHASIESISDEKATGLGIGYFVETVTRFTDQNDEEVGTMVFRVLKFKP